MEPGFTRALSSPPPDRRYYQVETLVFGRAVERATKPERYIVGCADPSRPLHRANFKEVLSAFKCPILPMRYESAELAKISINCCLVAPSVWPTCLPSFANRLVRTGRRSFPHSSLIGRIGEFAYLAPGLGIGGGNLERDLATVRHLAAAKRHRCRRRGRMGAQQPPSPRLGGEGYSARASRSEARCDDRRVGSRIQREYALDKNSPSLATISQLNGVRIRAHDPAVAVNLICRPTLPDLPTRCGPSKAPTP